MELISFPWRVALHLGGTGAVSQARVEVCVCICSCSILCEQLIVLLKDAEPMLGDYVAYGKLELLWEEDCSLTIATWFVVFLASEFNWVHSLSGLRMNAV